MAPLLHLSLRKVLVLYLAFLVLFTSVLLCASSESQIQSRSESLGRRRMLEQEIEDKPKSTKSTNLSSKNQTKLLKPNLSTTNQTKLLNPNQTKLTKSTNSIKTTVAPSIDSPAKSGLKKLNSTSKAINTTNMSTPNTKTTKPTSTKQSQAIVEKKINDPDSRKTKKNQNTDKNPKQQQKQTQPSWLDREGDDDLVAEFRDLPTKFHQTLIPDLERISTTSKAYITKANKEITKNFKPYVGNKYAPTITSFVSFAFIIIPLLLVSLIVNRIKAYFSLQRILIFIQVYLSIYFSILCLSSLVTGLEPLKFFYATARSTYICLQALQTLAYVLYLLLLLMHLVLVFSTERGLGSRLLGLGQTIVGFSVGLHYYVAVLRQPPKTSWKIHGIYATCFLVVCLFANAERTKRSYLEDGGGEGKRS